MKIIIPIVTIPIVSKVLGPSGIGVYNYTNSIAQYFILISSLGLAMYGNREIALAYNRNENISPLFWELFSFKALLTIIVLAIYLLIVSFFPNRNLFYIQGLSVLSVLFDISWFFMGIEDFKKTSMCNLLIQGITFIAIVIFVKDSNDTWIYTLIQSVGLLSSQMLVWLFIKPYIRFEKINLKNSFKHLKGSFDFFIPQVAIVLYTNLNKTLLGIFIGSTAVGYYTNSLTLNTVFITVITTLDVVLLPHMSGLFANNNTKQIVVLMNKTLHLQLFFSIPLMFGMLTVYDKIVPWFFGEKFIFIENVIPYFSILIVIVPLGIAISRQFLIPIGKVKEYNKSVIIGACINMIANIIFLPTMGFYGVVISNILAEFFVTVVRTRSFLRQTSFRFDFRKIIFFFISGLIMMGVTRRLTVTMQDSLLTNVLQVCIAAAIYLLITSIMNVNPLVELLKHQKK